MTGVVTDMDSGAGIQELTVRNIVVVYLVDWIARCCDKMVAMMPFCGNLGV